MTQFSKCLMPVVALILLAQPHSGFCQCTDSLTVSQVNEYLAKGAEARELLLIANERAQIDSAQMAIQWRQVLTAREQWQKETKAKRRWQWFSAFSFIFGLWLTK